MKVSQNRSSFLLSIIIFLSIIQISEQTTYSCDTNAACGCSIGSANVNKIVGGEVADTDNWSWAVSISIAAKYLCGGTILSSSWVITAAHCVTGFQASQITIYAGSNVRWTGNQIRRGSNVIMHPDYNSVTYVNDIALVRLESPLDMTTSSIKPICLKFANSTVLATSEWPLANTTVVAIGWGKLSENGSVSASLQQVTLQTIDRQASTCSRQLSDWHVQFCASVPNGTKDACQGDSGGPLMMFTDNNQWVLVGLTSNGVGCARANYSGIYTRVTAFENWINVTTNGSYTNSAASSIDYSRTMMIYYNLIIIFITTLVFQFSLRQ